MSSARKRLGQSGQAQLLAAVVFSGVMLSGGLFAMQWAQRNRVQDFYASRRVEMRSALEQAIKRAQQIYTAEAGCDPVSFDDKLAFMQPDGTIGATPGLRQLQITVNGHLYPIALSHPGRLRWTGETGGDPTEGADATTGNWALRRGVAQDLVIEAWTTYNSTRGVATTGVSRQRAVQRAVMLNTCTYTCSIAGSAECPVAEDRGIAYHRLNTAAFPGNGVYPGTLGPWNRRCFDPLGGTRYLGDLNTSPLMGGAPFTGVDGLASVEDLQLLKSYIRSGDWTGAGIARPNPLPPAVTHVSLDGNGALPCADLNGDSLVNETDLHILEKAMRGYLYWLPVHFHATPR